MWFKYPYTNFSELNLDWFLEQFKKLKDEWDTTSGEWDQMQLDFQTLEGTVQTFTTFVTNYFENLDVQQEINNKLDQMALDGTLADLLAPLVDDKLPGVVDDKLGAVVTDQLPGVVTDQLPGVVADQIDDAVAIPAADATTDWLAANVNPVGSAVTIDNTLTITGSAADAAITGRGIRINKGEIDNIIQRRITLESYLYKEKTIIDSTPAEVSRATMNLYKVPVSEGDLVFIEQYDYSNPFWGTFLANYVFNYLKTDNSYERCATYDAKSIGQSIPGTQFNVFFVPSGVTHIMLNVDRQYIDNVFIEKYSHFDLKNVISPFRVITRFTNDNTLTSTWYRGDSGNFSNVSSPYYAQCIAINSGDKIVFDGAVYSGLMGTFTNKSTRITVSINTTEFTAPADGFVFMFMKTGETEDNATLYPYDSIKIEAKNVQDLHKTVFNSFKGLAGVAFGTSLTEKASSTGGYLNFLPVLSQMTWDNQGAGSATILTTPGNPDILDIITNYASYADKRVCIIEGFVNDWYLKNPLGTFKSTGTTDVCGCLRSAITHILTQNPDITVYVVLDHFGSGICAPLATNGDGLTQLQYYQEIEKTALSMGIRVIREYEISEISELTPQYLLDTIHLNMLGAEQSANAIWSVMKTHIPNIT